VRYLWLLIVAALAYAQGTVPKDKAESYEESAAARRVTVGAEYLVHSFSADSRTFLAQDYLVVEAALFPKNGGKVLASAGDFELRLDGRRTLRPVSPTEVVQAMQRRGWTRDTGAGATISSGNSSVILGAPGGAPPYGQPTGRPAPRAPEPDYRGNVPRSEQEPPTAIVTRTAFPEGAFEHAVSGYLYFYYKGNAAKLRTVELFYGDAVLKLK
jgi:hypothetical protein